MSLDKDIAAAAAMTHEQQFKIEEAMRVIQKEPKLRKEFIIKLVNAWQQYHPVEWNSVVEAINIERLSLHNESAVEIDLVTKRKVEDGFRYAVKMPNGCITHQPKCEGLLDLFDKYLPDFQLFAGPDKKELHWFMRQFPELRAPLKV